MKKTRIVISGFVFLLCCAYHPDRSITPETSRRHITILYTNDEHGWMEPEEKEGGAAGLLGLWHENEHYSEDGPFLVLSGGDLWSGPAISTWFQGESMVAVMNAMGYDAVAIGNHEFDFKVEGLKERISQSHFPFLSANIRNKNTNAVPPFALPYIVHPVNGVNVGIIGLTTTTTPTSTFPDNVADYDFIPYAEALQAVVPQVKNKGAELLIVIGHICESEMEAIVPIASQLGISIITGGHCHELVNDRIQNVTLMEAGSRMKYYGRSDILFDTARDTIITIETSLCKNQNGSPDSSIQAIVSYWKARTDAELSHVIGYASEKIERSSAALANMVTDSWLLSFPQADVSLTNTGGIRQSIPQGEISLATLVGVLPFENRLVELEFTGSQLIRSIDNLLVGGMILRGGYRLSDGSPIHPDSLYRILTTDYLYSRPDFDFQKYDPHPYDTSVHYRQPVMDWIKSLNTSPDNPLNHYLDKTPRK